MQPRAGSAGDKALVIQTKGSGSGVENLAVAAGDKKAITVNRQIQLALGKRDVALCETLRNALHLHTRPCGIGASTQH